jgi:hypothetical protein
VAPKKKRGQTTLEYILMISVVVAATYAFKEPASKFLTVFFTGYTGKAATVVAKPTGYNYLSSGSAGCSSVKSASGGGSSCE